MHFGVTGERNLNEMYMKFCNSTAQHLEFTDRTETRIADHNACHWSSNRIALLSLRIYFIVFWRFDT